MYCASVCPFSPLVATCYCMGFQPRIFEVIPQIYAERDMRRTLLGIIPRMRLFEMPPARDVITTINTFAKNEVRWPVVV